jgi:hypothetical protein
VGNTWVNYSRPRGFTMKVQPFVFFGTLALGTTVILSRRGEPSVSMYPEDWEDYEARKTHRSYRSWRHALHHMKEAAGLAVPIAEVYILRTISPAFREQIMITTACCNSCPP